MIVRRFPDDLWQIRLERVPRAGRDHINIRALLLNGVTDRAHLTKPKSADGDHEHRLMRASGEEAEGAHQGQREVPRADRLSRGACVISRHWVHSHRGYLKY